ncbi:hypothetical protein Pcinc_007130 [Petrolisthes cinctipes]|uniref:Uncharacterized protein n=1 Tax=Petrolisthes cinctipes TaxID=88211 RepID=A0AAE1GBF3_PETCI|nr:hypothetical protein Pcinc_007130 [Petrolisthes cinctipes]
MSEMGASTKVLQRHPAVCLHSAPSLPLPYPNLYPVPPPSQPVQPPYPRPSPHASHPRPSHHPTLYPVSSLPRLSLHHPTRSPACRPPVT